MSTIEFEIDADCNPPQFTVTSDIAGDIIWIGEIMDNLDGEGYVFDPTAAAFSAQELRAIADKLDELNKGVDNV